MMKIMILRSELVWGVSGEEDEEGWDVHALD